MKSQKKFGPIFACFYPFFNVKLRAQVQDLQKREFYDLPEHGTATTKARGGLGTIQTSWAKRAIKIMAVDSCGITTNQRFNFDFIALSYCLISLQLDFWSHFPDTSKYREIDTCQLAPDFKQNIDLTHGGVLVPSNSWILVTLFVS